jgi:adenylate cyclase
MNTDAEASIGAWVTEAGLAGMAEPELLHGFCARAVAAGIPLSRGLIIVDTLHPIHEGRAFRWRRDPTDEPTIIEYGRTTDGGESAANWQRSPFYTLFHGEESQLRRNLAAGDPADYSVVADMQTQGQTDYLALINRFAAQATIGEMDCVYSSWVTDAPAGFGEDHVSALVRLAPSLALAIKCASLARIAETLVQTYLGRDAGRRVLSGRIARGVADRIDAVLWFSDLRGFTRITDTSAPEQVIPLLNDYAEAIISAIHEAGGDVLKLIGDGTLAIFAAENPAGACGAALTAQALARKRITALNERRKEEGQPLTQMYLGLHVGEVFYGNIGSRDRLDFTVIGPAVNEASRIAAMCRSVERDVLLSSAFASTARADDRARLVSVGRYALRGVSRPQELFTLEPDGENPLPPGEGRVRG